MSGPMSGQVESDLTQAPDMIKTGPRADLSHVRCYVMVRLMMYSVRPGGR
jgi:hypothetical protein